MGKKLRNRQLCDQNRLETVPQEKNWELAGELPNNRLKKMICKKLVMDSNNSFKQKKFKANLHQGSFCTLVNESLLECPICLEIMVKPTMMLCGHNYCFRCLESNAAFSQRCCLCRQSQMQVPHLPSRFAEKLIHQFFLPRSDQVIKYLCRTTDSDEWAKRRYVTNFRPGLVVDFHDSLGLWQRAVILNIEVDKNNNPIVVVKVGSKKSQNIEKVSITSKRLAPARFFTKGRYLQQFELSLPEYDLNQKQLYGLQYRYHEQEDQFFGRRNSQWDAFFQENYSQNDERQIENMEEVPSPTSVNFLDEALVLFNMQMNENDLII